ncbi:MAG: phosphoenolpyruvate carboxykinase domain-containing protein, partial [Hyphomonadaceae bacterium]
FGENARVLKWIVERLDNQVEAKDTPIGRLPTKRAFDVSGLSLTDEALELLLSVDPEIWREEASLIPPAYEKFGDRLPDELWEEHRLLVERLEADPASMPIPRRAANEGVRAVS